MFDIVNYLPARRKQSPSGWISFNAVCCQHNGHSSDQRQRGGLKITDQNWSYHCFNCGFTASFQLGRALSFKSRRLLSWLGVPDQEIEALVIESLRHKSIFGILDDRNRVANTIQGIQFEERDLPPAAKLITQEHPLYWDYVRKRCVPESFPLMTQIRTDGGALRWTRPSVIVPFTYDNRIVGWTSRFIDGKSPKFISDSQPGYVFGIDQQPAHWKHVLVMEGIFDALCIGGLAVMHNTISDAQVRLIRSLDRSIIVVPDQDRAGITLIDRAVELGWAVSIPDWGPGIKDVNDAVVKFGKLATLLTIMQARESSKIKIELKKKQLHKRFANE